ncbi:MAG: hypothetical protein IJA28_02745, partial [Coprobacter sp.]|nr:hypothetical protein [Coprobacter sp.]
ICRPVASAAGQFQYHLRPEQCDRSLQNAALYNFNNPLEYKLFKIDQTKQIIADYNIMVSKQYPGAKPNREYTLCPITEYINTETIFNINSLRDKYAPKVKYGVPFIIE